MKDIQARVAETSGSPPTTSMNSRFVSSVPESEKYSQEDVQLAI
jgi:hypothetical protein